MFFVCLCTFFVNSFSALEAKNLNNSPLVYTMESSISTGLTGQWKVNYRMRSSLRHGEKTSRKETYKTPVIYDFSTPNVLKVKQNGEVSSYKYKMVNNEIVISWVEPMAIEAIHAPTNYKIKKTGNKMTLVYEERSAAPNYYTVTIDLEE